MFDNLRRLARLAVVPLMLGAQQPAASAQSHAPADLRAALEGTWYLDEWHVNGQILRPPHIDGRWSNHDGVVMVMFRRMTDGGGVEATAGYGVYEMNADTWSYRYDHMETTTRSTEGPAKVRVSPPRDMRSFRLTRAPGKVVLEGAGGDTREYEGPFFSFKQNGQIVRKWRRMR